jgi:ubiquinone/menaquinone biosynthesis C-methylase UbiE
LIPLAHIATRVVGMDISRSMLAEARRNADARNAQHVELVVSDDTLSQAQGLFDLVHSCIVLQHIEIPRGRLLFDQLVRRVKPGGFGAIQVTLGLDSFPESFGQPPPTVAPSLLRQAKHQARQLLTVTRAGAQERGQQGDEAGSRDPEMQMNLYNLSELLYSLHQAGVRNMHAELTDHGGVVGAFLVFRRPV